MRALRADGHRVVLLKRSFSKTGRVRDLLEDHDGVRAWNIDETPLREAFLNDKIDVIAHFATDYGRKNVPPSVVIDANLALPLKLLELAREFSVGTFINTDTILDKRVSTYSLSKRQFAEWLEAFSEDVFGIGFVLEHFFGPGDDPTKFVSSMVAAMVRGEKSIDVTPGEQQRDFIFIDDVIDAFMTIFDRLDDIRASLEGGRTKRFEVGGGEPVSIREFLLLLKRLSGADGTRLRFGALPYRENESMESHVDLSELHKLGWRRRVTLEDGLKRTLEAEHVLRIAE